MSNIDYSYVDADSTQRFGTFEGSFDDAVEAGRSALDADSDGEWYAEETNEILTSSDGDLAALGAALLDGRPYHQVYSVWCNTYL